MPPSPKFTRDEIVAAALQVVSERGKEALSAREVAAVLGSSARPIFTVFSNMEELQQEGGHFVLSFGYQFEGVRIRRASGQSAAQVTLEGTKVTAFTLWPRRYAAGDGESLLLPLTQALAIARSLGGRELSVRYTDGGGDTLSAEWLAE